MSITNNVNVRRVRHITITSLSTSRCLHIKKPPAHMYTSIVMLSRVTTHPNQTLQGILNFHRSQRIFHTSTLIPQHDSNYTSYQHNSRLDRYMHFNFSETLPNTHHTTENTSHRTWEAVQHDNHQKPYQASVSGTSTCTPVWDTASRTSIVRRSFGNKGNYI